MPSGSDEPSGDDANGDSTDHIPRCDYCRLPIPAAPVELDHDGVTYSFCSEACKAAVESTDHVFTEYHGFRRCDTGVTALDSSLPEGMPRNSFVLLTDLAGSRTEALQAELVWRCLQRGEPVVLVSFLEPPVSLIQDFVNLEWNVIPSLENGTLQFVDCFSYRVDDRERMYERMDHWNTHLWNVAEGATTTVRDPSDVAQVQNRMDSALEARNMQDTGLVVIDSLTELGSLVQPVQAYDFVKQVRADVCKGRFVPVFANGTVTSEADEFPHDMGYMLDGMVEMRLNEELVQDALIKQIRVRKMNGVLTYPEWSAYEFAPGQGIVTFDPIEELEASEAEALEEGQPVAAGPPPEPSDDEPAPEAEGGTGGTDDAEAVAEAAGDDPTEVEDRPESED
jgi:KaiC/GvpD/RAD55 family RecA-like ATPase/YHS domain-containing protein